MRLINQHHSQHEKDGTHYAQIDGAGRQRPCKLRVLQKGIWVKKKIGEKENSKGQKQKVEEGRVK
jgi:hypothetical protein